MIFWPHSDNFEDEPFLIDGVVIGMIAELEQEEGVEIFCNDKTSVIGVARYCGTDLVILLSLQGLRRKKT